MGGLKWIYGRVKMDIWEGLDGYMGGLNGYMEVKWIYGRSKWIYGRSKMDIWEG